MPQDIVTFPMGGGLNRSTASHLSSREDFWEMLNFRPSRGEKGVAEQTPYFTLANQFTAQTYATNLAGGTAVEPTTSSVRGQIDYSSTRRLVLTDYSAHQVNTTNGNVTTLPSYFQVYATDGSDTLQTGCMLKINDPAALAVTLGNSIDIEIDGATTFRWRKNGGGWTSTVAITTAGVSIDSGSATVYFLIATGHTIGWFWKWYRLDNLLYSAQAVGTPPRIDKQAQFVTNQDAIYFLSSSGFLWKFVSNANGSDYVITAGYKLMSGRHIITFANHLFVAGKSYSATSSALAWSAGLAWSDLGNFDNFIATDTNEADIFYFRETIQNYSAYTPSILGLYVRQSQIYVILDTGIWSTSYVGLPVVFNFQELSRFKNYPFSVAGTNDALQSTLQVGNGYIYLFSLSGLFRFDGGSLTNVGAQVSHLFSLTNFPTAAVYLAQHRELCLHVNSRILVYQEDANLWYTRSASFSGTVAHLGTDWHGNKLLVGTASRFLYIEDVDGSVQPVCDASTGSEYATPVVTKHLFTDGSFLRAKEFLGNTSLAATIVTTTATYYSTSTNIYATLYSRAIGTTGVVDMGMPSAVTTGISWNTANPDTTYSVPRLAFRAATLELRLFGVGGKPPALLSLYNLETRVRGLISLEK